MNPGESMDSKRNRWPEREPPVAGVRASIPYGPVCTRSRPCGERTMKTALLPATRKNAPRGGARRRQSTSGLVGPSSSSTSRSWSRERGIILAPRDGMAIRFKRERTPGPSGGPPEEVRGINLKPEDAWWWGWWLGQTGRGAAGGDRKPVMGERSPGPSPGLQTRGGLGVKIQSPDL